MDIKRARDLLGTTGKKLTDDQVRKCVADLEILAEIAFEHFLSLSPEERKKYAPQRST